MIEAYNFLENKTPLQKFSDWLEEAKNTSLNHANAFTLSTVSTEAQPSSRIVLVKDVRYDGFLFYSNYLSRKGEELNKNPRAAANFYWDTLFRQVNFIGSVDKLLPAESATYWQTRPRMSQLAQLISRQSSPVAARNIMEQDLQAADKKFSNQSVPCPPHWGGYIFKPTKVEFWIGRDGRFHDRYCYLKVENKWSGERLYP